MRVLITGVSEPIARDLARVLLAAGHDVVGQTEHPHRYLAPGIRLVGAAAGDPATSDTVAGSDVLVHLAADGDAALSRAAELAGTRVVLPLSPGRPGDEQRSRAFTAGGVALLVLRTAPLVGRRVDATTLRTLSGVLRRGGPAQVLHHDDLVRALVDAVASGATGTVDLAAPGMVDRAALRRILDEAGVATRLRGVRPARPTPPLEADVTGPYGWTATEAVSDAARGLAGRRLRRGVASVGPGRFALPTEVVPNNLPASDGGHLVPAGPAEYQGEFDTLVDPRLAVQTATNVAEALPGPMTPITLDLQLGAIRIANEDMGRMLAMDGAALEQHTNLMVGALGHHVFMNASVGVNIVATMPGWDEESVRRDVYGQIPDDVDFRPEGGPPMPQGLAGTRATLRATGNVVARARKYKAEAERVNRAAREEALTHAEIADLDDPRLWARVLLWRDRLAHGWQVASIGVTLTGAAGAIHERGKAPEPIAIDVEQLASARTMLAVERIAASLRGDRELVRLAHDGRVDELRERAPQVARVLDEQLAVMGHRGPGECELANPAFADRPELLLGSAAGAAEGPAPRRERPAPPRSRTARMAVGATLAREQARDGVVRTTHCLRLAVRELGRRLVERGLLEQPDDAFYLTLDELYAAPVDAGGRVARRRAERERLRSIRMPDVVVGTWEPMPAGDVLGVGGELRGLGIFPGCVEGRVRVLRDPDDDIEPDDVLVASVTDVGHTAMFGYAAAVVTDIGGAASHAAIVAREFAVPCVVDTKNASTSLVDGQWVRVDGAAGTVTVLAEPGERVGEVVGEGGAATAV